jgi:hypothetical protein
MKKYIGVKIVEAEPMNLGDYNKFRGWTIPEDEDPERPGSRVVYEDGYVSWSPAEAFKAYRPCDGMTFGLAVEAMKLGYKTARVGWNGKGMFTVYQRGYPEGIPCNKQAAEAWGIDEGELFKVEPYLQIRMVNGSHAMWVPSINDVLAEDWLIIE